MKPDWSKAPKWARYWGTNEDGFRCWFECKPGNEYGGETSQIVQGRSKIDDSVPTFWRNSLQKRPEGM